MFPGGPACAVLGGFPVLSHDLTRCSLAFVLASTTVLTRSCFLPKELEQLAKEQDKESEKQALLQEVENHRKQMLR